SDALRVACRMDKSLSATIYTDDDEEINLDISIGAAVSCDMYESPEQILEEAYKAASRAPKQGRYRCRMCTPEYQQLAESRLTLESELYEAIAGRQIRPYYLPIVRITDKKVVGLEVLLRWKHPSGRMMEPEEFLDLCDRDQIIIPIGYELIKNAVEQLNKVSKIKALPEYFKLDFNLTDRQYYDEELLDSIKLICQKSAVKPHNIRFEVAEDIINKNFEVAAFVCENLQQAGIGCIIDRFGTSPLSFNNLLTFKAAGLKSNYKNFLDEEDRIKASKVCQIGHDMAKFLDIEFIASGINTMELSQALQEEDCLMQEGFAFGMPLTVADLEVIAENGYVLP
ncbi:EAL domain-containing protein, partial [bacterium]|nr:EAL domain-containing protein [bacterium]